MVFERIWGLNAMRRLSDDRGTTLVEVLVATVVIGIGLVGLAVVIPVSMWGVHEANALSTATFLAEQRIEEVRSAAWTMIPSTNDCLGTAAGAAPTSSTCTRTQPTPCIDGTSCTTYPDESAVSGYPAYSRTVRITGCAATACGGVVHEAMRLVRVTVSYQSMAGAGGTTGALTRSTSLELIVSRQQ
jgi:prepilin-type N-terminal cleavage/methylation domain-containing protein